jgi:hypothetical protein
VAASVAGSGGAPEPDGRGRPGRIGLWGVALAAAYLAVAVLSVRTGLIGGRPLYDGLARYPYRWVSPPPDRTRDNQNPLGAEAALTVNPSGVPDPSSVSTGDLQATLVVEQVDATAYSPDDANQMRVKITPLDPAELGARPEGRFFDGNAYRIEATYPFPFGGPVSEGAFDIVLTYAVHATDIRRWSGSRWAPLAGTKADRASLQIYGSTQALGTFVATGRGDVPNEPGSAPAMSGRSLIVWVVTGLGIVAGLGSAVAVRRRRAAPGSS